MVLGDGTSRSARALLAASIFAVALASAAEARVSLVATGTTSIVFLDITTREPAARLPLPGPARAVAVAPDGRRGYVAAGPEVVALDVNNRTEAGRTAFGVAPAIADIELSRSGRALYVVQGTRLLVLDATTLTTTAAIDLRAEGGQLAVGGAGGTAAAVVLANGRVAIVSLPDKRLLRRVKVKGATGVAIDDRTTTWVTTRGRLHAIAHGRRRARKRPIALPRRSWTCPAAGSSAWRRAAGLDAARGIGTPAGS